MGYPEKDCPACAEVECSLLAHEQEALVQAAEVAADWKSSTFPQGEPVDHETHEQICADIAASIAEAIRALSGEAKG